MSEWFKMENPNGKKFNERLDEVRLFLRERYQWMIEEIK